MFEESGETLDHAESAHQPPVDSNKEEESLVYEDDSSGVNDVAKEVVRQSILMSIATDITDHIVDSALEQVRSQELGFESASESIPSPFVEIIDETNTEKHDGSDLESVGSDEPNHFSVKEKYEFEVNKESSNSTHSENSQGIDDVGINNASLAVPVVQAGPINEARPHRDLPSNYADKMERGDMLSSSFDEFTSPLLSSEATTSVAAVREVIPEIDCSRAHDMHTTASVLTTDIPKGATNSIELEIPKIVVSYFEEDNEHPVKRIVVTDDTASTNALVESLPTGGDQSVKPISVTNDRENRTELDQMSFKGDDTQLSMSISASMNERNTQPHNAEAPLDIKSSDISMSVTTSLTSSEAAKLAVCSNNGPTESLDMGKDAPHSVRNDEASLAISDNQTVAVNKTNLGDASIGELQLSMTHEEDADISAVPICQNKALIETFEERPISAMQTTSASPLSPRPRNADNTVLVQDAISEFSENEDHIHQAETSSSNSLVKQSLDQMVYKDSGSISEEELMMAEAEAMFFDDLDAEEDTGETLPLSQETDVCAESIQECRPKIPMMLACSDPKLNTPGCRTSDSCCHRSGENKIQCLDLSCVCHTESASLHHPLQLHAAPAETNLSYSTISRCYNLAGENVMHSLQNQSNLSAEKEESVVEAASNDQASGTTTAGDVTETYSESISVEEAAQPEMSVQTESCPKLIAFSQQPADPPIEIVEEAEEQSKERATAKAQSAANMITQVTKSPESVRFASATNLNLSDKMMRIRQEKEKRGCSGGEGEKKGSKVITTGSLSLNFREASTNGGDFT